MNDKNNPPFKIGDLVETKPFFRINRHEIGIVTDVVYKESEWFVNIDLVNGSNLYTYHGYVTLLR